MATASPIDVALEGDTISMQALETAINFCNNQADALNEELKACTKAGVPTDELNAIRNQRNALRARAMELAAGSIKLQAGEAKISADHIASAVAAAQATIASIKQFKDRLKKLGAAVDFFATLLTGSGEAILKGATTLKDALKP